MYVLAQIQSPRANVWQQFLQGDDLVPRVMAAIIDYNIHLWDHLAEFFPEVSIPLISYEYLCSV